ncbi:MAG: DEAD/DEAH box helicase [Eubacterium sp.]|nr:DEAD/DEAH box helicase [Eubacterium sp.]
MKALIISLESFQKGEIPFEVQEYLRSCDKEPFIILDESSKIKTNNPCKDSKKSKRTQAVLKLNNIGERCILTGTFMSKSPLNAYDQMNFLQRDFFPESMFAFAEHYTIRRTLPSVRGARILITQKDYETIRKRLMKYKNDPVALGGAMDGVYSFYGITREDCIHIMKNPEYTPFKNMEELWNRIGDNCMKVDRKTSTDLPPKIYKTYDIPLTKEQKQLYLQLQNQHCTDRIVVDNGLKLYLRFQDVCNGYEPIDHGDTIDENGKVRHNIELKPLIENPKLDMLEEIVDDIGDKQIVIWCSRTKLLYDAEKRMREAGYTTAIYDGKVDKKLREEGYQSFSEDKTQLIFINQASGAYGLDGLKEADYAIYLCNSYSVEQRAQSENRIYRGVITRSKYIIDLTCKGTCEDRVTEALKQGKELLDMGTTDVELFKYYGD